MKKLTLNWVIVTKNKSGGDFYPIHQLRKKLGAKVITYLELPNISETYWQDKNVIFHLVWANNSPTLWRPYYKSIAKNANSFIFEFDADTHMNRFESLDIASWGDPFLFHHEIVRVSPNFIWELPTNYNPFVIDTVKLELNLYEKSLEVGRKEKTIDVLGFVDNNNTNLTHTLRLLEVLHKNKYSVKCIRLSNKYSSAYNNLPFEIIKNTKFNSKGQKIFYSYLDKSKVYLDLTTRLTAGRNLYEALFRNCIPIASSTYGASKLGVSIDTLHTLDLQDIYSKCVDSVKNYEEQVKFFQDRANDRYNIKELLDGLKLFTGTKE